MASYALQSALATETTRAEGVEAGLAATVAGLAAKAWLAATAYPAESIVSNGVGLYQAPSGGVPARSTFTSSDWIHLADIAAGGLQAANNLSDVSNAGSARANVHVPILAACQAVGVANVNIASPGAAFNGFTLTNAGTDQVLLTAQTTASQNGPWIWNGAASALTRPTDYPHAGVVKGREVQISNASGTGDDGSLWVMLTASSITIDTTATTWQIANRVQNDARYAQSANNGSDFGDAGSTRANLHVPVLASCQAVAVGNITLSGSQTIDGYAAVAGDVVLASGQTTASQNGPWVVASGAWTRPTDYASAAVVKGRNIQVNAGTLFGGSIWVMATSTSVTVDTTATVWWPSGRALGRSALVTPNEYWVSNGALASDTNSGQKDSPFATIAAAMTALSSNRGVIHLGYGDFASSANISLAANQQVWGLGYGTNVGVPGASRIVKSGNIDGVTLVGSGAGLRGVDVFGAASNTLDGIVIEQGVGCILEDVSSMSHGGVGVRIGAKTTTSSNVNGWTMRNVQALGNTGDGFYVNDFNSSGGPNCNAGNAFGVQARGNGGDGIHVDASIDNTWHHVQCSSNTGYGIHLGSAGVSVARGQVFLFPYLEANTAGDGIMDASTAFNKVFGGRQGVPVLGSTHWVNNGNSTNHIAGLMYQGGTPIGWGTSMVVLPSYSNILNITGASIVNGSYVTLAAGSNVPAGARAVCLSVATTDSTAGTAASVRFRQNGVTTGGAFSDGSLAAPTVPANGVFSHTQVVCPVDSAGNVQYKPAGYSAAGGQLYVAVTGYYI
ncbi:MAG TPA: hypothetical protein VHU85_08465 [Acidimicrobiales bacterium]|nr:hypothetical protein [Acidimicrobiales bacterium]